MQFERSKIVVTMIMEITMLAFLVVVEMINPLVYFLSNALQDLFRLPKLAPHNLIVQR